MSLLVSADPTIGRWITCDYLPREDLLPADTLDLHIEVLRAALLLRLWTDFVPLDETDLCLRIPLKYLSVRSLCPSLV